MGRDAVAAMSLFALTLVLIGACCHAWWNLILKRTGGGTGFFLLFSGFSALLIAPIALAVWWIEQRNRDGIRQAWKSYRKEALFVAVLSPLSYILALTAMRFTPVSSVAPAREVGILIAALLGARVLGETDARRRLAAAALMITGLAALALG